jgi:hypothetical protein
MTKTPTQPSNTFARPKKKTRLKPGHSISVSPEERAKYEELIKSKDATYEQIVSADRRKT